MSQSIDLFGEETTNKIEAQLREQYPQGVIADPELVEFSNVLCDAWPKVKSVLELLKKLIPKAEGICDAVLAIGEGAYRVFCKKK